MTAFYWVWYPKDPKENNPGEAANLGLTLQSLHQYLGTRSIEILLLTHQREKQISLNFFHDISWHWWKAVARTFWHCPLESGSFSSPKVAPTPNKKLKQSSPWCLKTKMGDWISQVIRHLSKFQPTCGSRCGPMVCLCSMATYPFSHASMAADGDPTSVRFLGRNLRSHELSFPTTSHQLSTNHMTSTQAMKKTLW